MYRKFKSPTCFPHEIFFNLSPTIFQAMLCFFCLLLSALKIWAEDFSWCSPPLFMTRLLLRIMPNKRSTWTNIDLSLYWKVCLLCKAIHHTNYLCVSMKWKNILIYESLCIPLQYGKYLSNILSTEYLILKCNK